MNYSFIKINQDLPIATYEEEIISKFESSSNMIIIGETGSGKTTQIPLMLLKSLSKFQNLLEGKIVVTEPRRLAATSVAEYTAHNLGEELGQSVGYKIRFNETASEKSILLFVTDGIMLREAQLDPLLLDYSVIMVDEAHERNINSDFLIGLLVQIQKKRKEQGVTPLKIIVTSATLEKDKFEDYFHKLPDEPLSIVEVPGRLYPITTEFEPKEVFNYEQRAAEKVEEICKQENIKYKRTQESSNQNSQDILIFMPGKREIEKTKELITALPDFEKLNLEIVVVHANLPIEEQNEIFKKTDKRKVVIATNIAETSLTVPGVVHVIDSGLIKQMQFNPHTGIKTLMTQPHAKKGLEQRKGRSGRVEPGYYHALYTQRSFEERPEFQVPEILRSSLSQIILIMKRIGIEDIEHFKFIDQPDFQYITKAIQELQRYYALDKYENITDKGLIMANLPLEPKLSNFVIEANKNGCVNTICTLCSFLELKPIILNLTFEDFIKEITEERENSISEEDIHQIEDTAYVRFKRYENTINNLEHHYSDFFTILNIWNLWNKNHRQAEWSKINFVSQEVLEEAANIREELLEIAQKAGYDLEDKKGKDFDLRIEKTLYTAFKFNILLREERFGSYRNIRSNERGIRLHNSSVLRETKPQYAVAYEIIEINEIDSAPKLSAKILHALDSETIRKIFPEFHRKQKKIARREGRRSFKFRMKRKSFNKRR